ncbi:hypothetical protein WS80_01595 [Burkholderia pseudomultivorans]|nr:hypothetical protein WS80_01595 [Burkholderia pseudomultivorans]
MLPTIHENKNSGFCKCRDLRDFVCGFTPCAASQYADGRCVMNIPSHTSADSRAAAAGCVIEIYAHRLPSPEIFLDLRSHFIRDVSIAVMMKLEISPRYVCPPSELVRIVFAAHTRSTVKDLKILAKPKPVF